MPPIKPNITEDELKAIKELRGGPVKGGVNCGQGGGNGNHEQKGIHGQDHWIIQWHQYLQDHSKDPTNKLKNKLIGILKDKKQIGGLKDSTYHIMYPTSADLPKFYGLTKIHKVGSPLRPIVSSRGSITYVVVK